MISFVIPAHNEEELLGRTLDSVISAAKDLGVAFEVIVVDDASTDRTAAVARKYGARVIAADCRQIAATRNSGARAARGDHLIFIDADTVVERPVVRAALEAMENGAAGGGCAVRFDGSIPAYAAIIHPILTVLFRFAGLACGCFVFCTREAFEGTGGFDEKLYASEEIAFSVALKRQGPFIVLREWVTTSGRKLRTYTGGEVLRIFGKFAISGPKSLRKRDGLDLWYGKRREDPEMTRLSKSTNDLPQ
jgi:glycosyltransferase involved in cell wall biosynthesis